MRVMLILFAMTLLLASSTSEQPSAMTQTYLLPAPHRWDMQQTLKCKAVSSVSLRQKGLIEKGDENTLVAEASPGTDKIELTLVKDTLLVRLGERETDRYKVTGNTKSFLGAVFIGDVLPVVHSMVIHKEKSYVSWTINEPMDVFTNIPYSQSVFFACQ